MQTDSFRHGQDVEKRTLGQMILWFIHLFLF